VGDGGPERTQAGIPTPGVDGPSITNTKLKQGTIFASSVAPQVTVPGIPQVASSSIAVYEEESVAADGLLCKITIDTTGFTSGTWDLILVNLRPNRYRLPARRGVARG
jgi:hypothetical protein